MTRYYFLSFFLYIAGIMRIMGGVCDGSPLYEWAVVGGGPSGIITACVLAEVGVPDQDVCLIDATFGVGRLGAYYATVPSNNKAKKLVEFLSLCTTFQAVQTPAVEALKQLNPEQEYELKYIIDVLQDISDYLLERMHSRRGLVQSLDFVDGVWHIAMSDDQRICARRVVLAIGAHPRSLDYLCSREIPLDSALNRGMLAQQVTSADTVAVVGGAHSAVLVMKFLYEAGVGRIINFYRQPLYYLSAEEEASRCTLQVGPLAGMAAEWARDVLDTNPPANLIRLKNTPELRNAWLPVCTKIVYAAGFERNSLPTITGMSLDAYDATTGIIGEHLFGIGIAFPEQVDLGNDNCKNAIGLSDFVSFAQRMTPLWMTRSVRTIDLSWCERYADIFSVTAL